MPDEPCLLLCLQLNLLTLIFSNQDFTAPELTSSEQLFRLRIPPGQKQLPVPLKEEMRYIPLFRRSENTVNGVRISNDQALPDSAPRSWMVTLGCVTGMELRTGPYTFRRGTGAALDNSSKYHDRHRFSSKLSAAIWKGFISESQQLILQHHNSTVFLKRYLSRYITSDPQAARRGLSRRPP